MVKITPNNIYNTSAFEEWLNEKAKNGFFIESVNSFCCVFKKSEPAELFYKLIPVGKKNREDMSDELIEEYAKKNIGYSCTYSEHFHVMYSKDKENPEFSAESEEINKNYGRLINNNYFYMGLWIAVFIAVLVMIFADISRNGAFLYNIIKHRYWALQLFTMIASGFAANKCRINIKNIKNTMKGVSSGKKSLKYSMKAFVSLALSFVILFSLTVQAQMNSWHKNLENIPKTLPIVLLNMVERNEGYHRYNPVSVGDGLVRDTNSAKFSYSILAPKQYEIVQVGIIDDETVEVNGKKEFYTPSSNVDFLRLASPAMTKTIFNDLQKTHNFLKDFDDTQVINVEDTGFEEAVMYKLGSTELFFGYYDNNAVFLSYKGKSSMLDFIDVIYESIEYLEF